MKFKKVLTALALISLPLSTVNPSSYSNKIVNNIQVKDANSIESSLFDGLLNLIKEEGGSLVKDFLVSTTNYYICERVFDSIGLGYSDTYTKNIKEVNEKLNSIQSDLKQLIKSQTVNQSEKTIYDFYNIVDVFTNAVHPIYMGYNELLNLEKNGLSKEEAYTKETDFYNNNIKNIFFGNGTSTGSLYNQLASLYDKILEPNIISNNTLMEHYVVTYEHRWAFNSQSFKPKKDFLSYVSANALQGFTLYNFQYLKEREIYQNDAAQIAVLEGRWKIIKNKSTAVFDYLQKELTALENEETTNKNNNMIIHYATGKKLSKKLYVGGLLLKSNSHFTYAYSSNTTRQGNMRNVEVITLNARSFANQIKKDFESYKRNYRKGNNCTLSDFLKDAGFECDDWNNKGLYRGQNYKHKGTKFSTERWQFSVEYTDQKGINQNSYYGDVKQKVLGTPSTRYGDASNYKFMAFVDTNGYLIGNDKKYEQIYDDNGNTIVDRVYGFICKNGSNAKGEVGKVW